MTLLGPPSLSSCNFPTPKSVPGNVDVTALTFLLKVHFFFPWPSQAVQGVGSLAAKLILTRDMVGPPRRVLLLLIVVVIQDGGLSDGHADDRVVGLQPRGAEGFPGLGPEQH